MTSKRAHTKSRLGCAQCKKRRIKCDEKPPCCSNCAQKGLECDFQEYAAVFDALNVLTPDSFGGGKGSSRGPNPPSTQSHEGSDSNSPPTAAFQPGGDNGSTIFDTLDLGLLHHFTLYTAPTIPVIDSELYVQIWQQEVPVLAQKHGFLMHALLGFAAAHRAVTGESGATLSVSSLPPSPESIEGGEGRMRDWDRARGHYSQALVLFREAIAVVDESKAEVLLCFSILIAFLTLVLECDSTSSSTSSQGVDVITGVATFLRTVKSATSVLRLIGPSLRTSKIGVLLSHTWNRTPHELDPVTAHSLDTLDAFAASTSPPEPVTSALTLLRTVFSLASPQTTGFANILLWPTQLEPGFVDALDAGHPLALCALAHWCLLVSKAPGKWFTGDWGARVMAEIARRLTGTGWEIGIAWPMREGGVVGMSGQGHGSGIGLVGIE